MVDGLRRRRRSGRIRYRSVDRWSLNLKRRLTFVGHHLFRKSGLPTLPTDRYGMRMDDVLSNACRLQGSLEHEDACPKGDVDSLSPQGPRHRPRWIRSLSSFDPIHPRSTATVGVKLLLLPRQCPANLPGH